MTLMVKFGEYTAEVEVQISSTIFELQKGRKSQSADSEGRICRQMCFQNLQNLEVLIRFLQYVITFGSMTHFVVIWEVNASNLITVKFYNRDGSSAREMTYWCQHHTIR